MRLAALLGLMSVLTACGGGGGGGENVPITVPPVPDYDAGFCGEIQAAGGVGGPGPAAASDTFAQIVAQMEPGRWREIPNTRMQDVFPPKDGHPAWGNVGPAAVTGSSGGAAYDKDRRLLVVTGGGGSDYGGNEVYHFSLDTLSWVCATQPSSLQEYETNKFQVTDGSSAPVASKTFDGLEYAPSVQRVFKVGGDYYKAGSYDPHAYLYDPVTGTWERRASMPTPPGAISQPSSTYDPLTGRLLVAYGNGVVAYDPVADVWAMISSGNNQNFGRVAAFDPVRRRIVQSDPLGTQGDLAYFDVDAENVTRQWAQVGGANDFNAYRAGIAYHPGSDRYVLWNGDREVWAVDPATWESRKYENPNGHAPMHVGTSPGRLTSGIYGRWQYIEQYDVFLAYPHSSENVWLYKLPAADFAEVAIPDDCGGHDLCIGPNWRLAKPSQAAAIAQEGQTIGIAAGDYEDCASWTVSVTIEGVGGRARVHDKTCEGKGVFVTKGAHTVIRNIELSGASGGSNVAGIRHEGKVLIVEDSVIRDNAMGILTGHGLDVELEVYNSRFYGQRSSGALAHNVYAGKIGRFVAIGNEVTQPYSGHLLKTVARDNVIAYNRLIDDVGTQASIIDIWGCSESVVLGNTMFKRDITGGLYFVGLTNRTENGVHVPCPEDQQRHAYLSHNTAVFTHPTQPTNRLWAAFVHNLFGTPYVTRNNLSVNTHDFASPQSHTLSDTQGDEHLTTPPPPGLFVDAAAHDYRLAGPRRPAAATEHSPQYESRPGAGTNARPHGLDVGAHAYVD